MSVSIAWTLLRYSAYNFYCVPLRCVTPSSGSVPHSGVARDGVSQALYPLLRSSLLTSQVSPGRMYRRSTRRYIRRPVCRTRTGLICWAFASQGDGERFNPSLCLIPHDHEHAAFSQKGQGCRFLFGTFSSVVHGEVQLCCRYRLALTQPRPSLNLDDCTC